MVSRTFNPLKTRSFFVFGPRGVGKSTWIREQFHDESKVILVNLLDPQSYESFLLEPKKFQDLICSPQNLNKIVIVDEVLRVPALLDIAHDLISKTKRVFVFSASSARRFKQKGVNLLAGRASVYHLYPFSMEELGAEFDLRKALERGLLPEAYCAKQELEWMEYLKSYVLTYIEKEIQQEQWVRKIEPFRKFLNIAAQMNAKLINKSKIAKLVGTEASTIESYFEILEDTLLGFRLSGFDTSIRKQVNLASKFYFVDTGMVRAIEKTLALPLVEHNSSYGNLFESFVILEIRKFIEYQRLEWSLNYFQTRDGVEIDLVISRPRNSPILIEIKSANRVDLSDAKSLQFLGPDFDKKFQKKCPRILVSDDPLERLSDGVSFVHYKNLVPLLRNLE